MSRRLASLSVVWCWPPCRQDRPSTILVVRCEELKTFVVRWGKLVAAKRSILPESWSFAKLRMNIFGDPTANLPKVCADIGVSEKRFLKDVAVVKAWLKHQPHLPKFGDALVVENMLLISNCSVELAKQAIDKFFSVRGRFPELFTGTDPCSKKILANRQIGKDCFLKTLTPEGYRIAVIIFPDAKHLDVFDFRSYLKFLLINLDLLISKDISAGVIGIVDMSMVSYQHTPEILKNSDIAMKTAYCVFNGYRPKVKAVHVVFPPPAAQAMIELLVKFAPKELVNRYFIHSNLESLHKHCPKEVLPKDYGGDQKTFQEMAAEQSDEITAYREYFVKNERAWLTDESKRPAKSVYSNANESFGYNGSFRKLEVD